MSDVRSAVLSATRHVESLAELFAIELREYTRSQIRRIAALVLAAVLLLCAYIVLCIWGALALMPLLGLQWALLVIVLVNVVLALVALLVAALCKPSAVAPATQQELKNDLQCVKLYLKGKGNS